MAIYVGVSKKPDPKFTKNPNFQVDCVNTAVSFTNSTTYNQTITNPLTGPPFLCGNAANIPQVWVISPTNGVVKNGNWGIYNNGVILASGDPTISATFSSPGYYDIKMYTSADSCGLDSTVQTICIRNPPDSLFTIPIFNCTSDSGWLIKTLKNDTGCHGNILQWEVDSFNTYKNPRNCGPTTGKPYEIRGGGINNDSIYLKFKKAGYHNIKLYIYLYRSRLHKR